MSAIKKARTVQFIESTTEGLGGLIDEPLIFMQKAFVGKTEIAIRAAFKAVQDGKQVAVLVPTTLLVQQHTKTFEERYSGFPIKVAGLSRFNTAKESKEI